MARPGVAGVQLPRRDAPASCCRGRVRQRRRRQEASHITGWRTGLRARETTSNPSGGGTAESETRVTSAMGDASILQVRATRLTPVTAPDSTALHARTLLFLLRLPSTLPPSLLYNNHPLLD